MNLLSWNQVPKVVECIKEKKCLGSGGFPRVNKATSHPTFAGSTWVIKRYRPEAETCIADTGQSVEKHNKKAVQMHLLAMTLALQLENQARKDGNAELFGEFLTFQKIYHDKTSNGENHVTIEEYIPGKCVKHLNSNGMICGPSTNSVFVVDKVLGQNAECLSHYFYEMSDRKIMLVDLHGSGYRLFDPDLLQNKYWMKIIRSSIAQEISQSWPSPSL